MMVLIPRNHSSWPSRPRSMMFLKAVCIGSRLCPVFSFFPVSLSNAATHMHLMHTVEKESLRMFYGPGGPYALFAGKDASRALAKMSFEEKDLTGDISGLGPFELEALQDWEYKFMTKYVKVGTIKKTVPVTEGDGSGEASGTTESDVKPSEDGPTQSAVAGKEEKSSAADAREEDIIGLS
ncbi:membrane steroid-binding protein 1-like isoform X2 [Durio zibethinus]|uniref:Membrane steroid-binding protein 1-like isoform X2 n=1 Tax=Durio zibethinus TaxID=66656 RepID=A0A6P5X9Y7_DURZI|nr:membrane steroid-binding protein 1-like isoform X2 [Durio zibethinus]